MTHVSRHEVDLDHAKRLRDGSRRLIPTMSRRFREKPDLGNAETLGTCALDVVQCNVLLDPAAEENVELIRIAARTAALHWALHHSGGRPVEMPIASDAPERVEGNVDESELSSASWLKAFHLAALADDPIALAAICYAPIDVWRSSPTKTEEYTHLFADAMRKYVLRDETAGATLLDALRASDPARRQYLDVDWILDIDVPVIEVATRLFSRDSSAMDASLIKAFELFRTYWTRRARPTDPKGWFATSLAAQMMLAWRAGMTLRSTSDYVPVPLLDRLQDARSHALVLCPYCVVPIPASATVCHACLEDPRKDAAIEETVDEYQSAPRKRCSHCATAIHHLAVRCPACRTRFTG